MPKTKITKKDTLDKFYTKPEIAKSCIDIFVQKCHPTIFVEPSAGQGAFFTQLPTPKIGIDIAPEHPQIIQHDWLTYVPPSDCSIIGNPPFGSRNDLSKSFIRHSLQYAKHIAFILPEVFEKETLQTVFPNDWSLIHSHQLPKNQFTLNGTDYHVPCVFQIWEKDSSYPNIRKSVQPKASTTDFTFDKNGEWFVFGASPGKIISRSNVTQTNRGYYVTMADIVRKRFAEIDWKQFGKSSVNGGVQWFTKQQIIDIYEEHYGKK